MRAKVRAGGILRTSADTTWQTPKWLLEPVRQLVGNPIPFDPATALDNPTGARLYCAGPPGNLFGTAESLRCDVCARVVLGPPELPSFVPDADCPRCRMARKNGLGIDWLPDFWVNPPFTKEWIEKLGREVLRVGRGVALLPCNRYEEPYLQDVLALARCVCFVDAKPYQPEVKNRPSRIAFISSKDGAPVDKNPFASMVLGFGYEPDAFAAAFSAPAKPMGASFLLTPIGARCAS